MAHEKGSPKNGTFPKKIPKKLTYVICMSYLHLGGAYAGPNLKRVGTASCFSLNLTLGRS